MGKPESLTLAREAIARGAMQHEGELAALAREITGRGELRHVLEVGVGEGGTLWLWCQLALPNASVAAVDVAIDEDTMRTCYGYRRAEQKMTIWPGDSHDPAVIARVAAYCGRRLDLLYIDGDHSAEGVQTDFYSYLPLVRPGGAIVLHDTALEGPGTLLGNLAAAASAGGQGFTVCEMVRRPDPADPQRERAGVPGAEWGGFGIITRED